MEAAKKNLKNHSPKTRHNKGQKIMFFDPPYNLNFCIKVKIIPQRLYPVISNNYPNFSPAPFFFAKQILTFYIFCDIKLRLSKRGGFNDTKTSL